MKMNTELLTDYLNEKCSEEGKQKIESWRKENPENQKYLDEIQLYWDAKQTQSDQIEFDVEKGLRELMEKKAERKNIFVRRFIKYAAVITILVATSIFGYLHINQNPSVVLVNNTEDSEKLISLPDGSSVSLAKGSTIMYLNKFTQDERLIELKGEAFFEVVKNKSKPFCVLTANTRTRVLGTSFLISEKSDRTTIEVHTGVVEFMEILNPSNKVKLEMGSMAEFITNQKAVLSKKSVVEDDQFSVQFLKYQNEKLELVCNDLNELFNENIQLAGDNISNILVTAVFEDQDLESILQSICFALNLEIEKNENYILLK